MGGVVKAVSNVVSSVTHAATSVVASAGNLVSNVAKTAVNVVQDVGKVASTAVQAAVNDPIGTIAKVAAVATGNAELLPIISAADTVAHGGDLGKAATSAALAYAVPAAGQEATAALQGTTAGNLLASANQGIASTLGENAAATPLTSAGVAAAASALQGGNPIKAAENSLIGGAINNAINNVTAPTPNTGVASIAPTPTPAPAPIAENTPAPVQVADNTSGISSVLPVAPAPVTPAPVAPAPVTPAPVAPVVEPPAPAPTGIASVPGFNALSNMTASNNIGTPKTDVPVFEAPANVNAAQSTGGTQQETQSALMAAPAYAQPVETNPNANGVTSFAASGMQPYQTTLNPDGSTTYTDLNGAQTTFNADGTVKSPTQTSMDPYGTTFGQSMPVDPTTGLAEGITTATNPTGYQDANGNMTTAAGLPVYYDTYGNLVNANGQVIQTDNAAAASDTATKSSTDSSTLGKIASTLLGGSSGSGSLLPLAAGIGAGALLSGLGKGSSVTPVDYGYDTFDWNASPVNAAIDGVAYGQSILNPTFTTHKNAKEGGQVSHLAQGGSAGKNVPLVFADGGHIHRAILQKLHHAGHPINQQTIEEVAHLVRQGAPEHHIIGFMHYRKKMASGGTTSPQMGATDEESKAAFNAAYPSQMYTTPQTNQYPQWLIDALGAQPNQKQSGLTALMRYLHVLPQNAVAEGTVGIPTSDQQTAAVYGHAAGGPLGAYSDGGHFLKGPGDGMSDDIPARIGQHQEARLANEEFVIPADVVSHLGNGSSESGAKVLYDMMDKVRKARTGTTKQGKQINPRKFMPKG